MTCFRLLLSVAALLAPTLSSAQEPVAANAETLNDDLAPQEAEQQPPPIPDAVMEMLRTALAARDNQAVRSIARIARIRYPDGAAEVDTLVAAFEEEQRQFSLFFALRDAPPLSVSVRRLEPQEMPPINPRFWKGKLELGGFRSTGSTDEIGVTAGLTGSYTIGRWDHKLRAKVDYREANGRTSREHILAAYEPRLRFSPDMFVYGLGQYERAPFIGFVHRYTASLGVGYTVLDDNGLRLAVDAGPAYRKVDYVRSTQESRLGLRSSLDFDWKLSPTISFAHNTYGYVEKDVGSLTLNNVLDARVMARLSTRLSYDVQFESNGNLNGRTGRDRLDTLSRVSLVYDF